MKLRGILVFLTVATLLTACATQYNKIGLMGGYVDRKIEPGVYYILISGNSFTQRESVGEMMLLRAAEVTLQEGYPRFLLFHDRKNDKEAVAALKRKQVRAFLIKRLETEGVSGNKVVIQQKSTRLTSQYYNQTIRKSGSAMIVVMLKPGDPHASKGIVAKDVVAELQKKYRKST